jgi:hypothetical protein
MPSLPTISSAAACNERCRSSAIDATRACKRSVSIEPGLMALTRTPSVMPRSDNALVRLSNAAFTDPPIVNSALAVRPPTPTILTIAPRVCIKCCQAARAQRIAAKNFNAKPSCQSRSLNLRKSPRLVAPALLIKTSTLPKRAVAKSIRACGDCSSRRSHGKVNACDAQPSATTDNNSAERAAKTKCIPSPARCVAIALPMPRLAPVMIATLSRNCRSTLHLEYFECCDILMLKIVALAPPTRSGRNLAAESIMHALTQH